MVFERRLILKKQKTISSRKIKVIAISMGKTLTTLVGIITAMVLSRLLDKTDYATYRQTLLAFTFVMPFLSLGMVNSINYYLPIEKERPRGVVNDAIISLLIMGVLFSLFLSLGGNRLLAMRFSNPAIEKTLLYLIPQPIFAIPATLLGVVMVVSDKVFFLSVFNVISRLFVGLSVIIPALIWGNVDAPIIGGVAFTSLSGCIAIVFMNRYSGATGNRWPSLNNIKKMVAFGFPLGLATMIGIISRQLDKILVSSMCTPQEFSVYVNGAMEIPIIGIITGSISAVLLPDLRRMVVNNNYDHALKLFRSAALKSAKFLIPTFIFLMVTADPFIITLFSEKYADSAIAFRLYLLIVPVRIVQFGAVLLVFGKNRLIFFQVVVSLLFNLILSVFLVSKAGYLGAVIGTIAVTYLWDVSFNIVQIKKLFKIPWYKVLPFKSLFVQNWYLIIPTSLIIVIELYKQIIPGAIWRLIVESIIFSGAIFLLQKDSLLNIIKELKGRGEKIVLSEKDEK